MDWFRSHITRHPKRAMVFGKTLFLAGSILVMGAVFARAGLSNTNAQRVEAKQPPVQTLARVERSLRSALADLERLAVMSLDTVDQEKLSLTLSAARATLERISLAVRV